MRVLRTVQRHPAAVALLALALAGCSTSGAASPPSTTITVLAASSLTGAFTELGTRFEADHPGTHVVFSFGGSSTLATQITQGASADVFASAGTTIMDAVVTSGDADQPTVFARNHLAIAVPSDNPAGIASLADLARSGVKVAVCQPAVPCGALATTVLRQAGLTLTPVSLDADVKAVLTKVTLGEVDAGLVYVTDVASAGDEVVGIEIPADVNASTDYTIATLSASPHRDTAQAFTDYVSSDAASPVLTDAGFTTP